MITGVLTVNVVAPENALIIFSVKPENVRLVATNIGDEACQNDSVSLSCSADASPPVSSYQFFENDVLLGSNNSGMWTTSLSSSGMLIYRCVASNLVGAANSANVSIDVGGTVTCTCESLRPPPPFLLEEWFFYRFQQKKKSVRKSRPHISFSNSFTSSKKLSFHQFVLEIGDFLTHSGANCVVSTEFHCAILAEETRITSKILFYQLSRQRQFSPIFCTQIPLEPARKLYRLGVLFTGENVRCCAAPILKVTDISDTFLCHSLAQCKQAFIRYHIAFYFDKKGVPVYCRCTLSLVSSVGRAPVCWAGGHRFKPQSDQHSGSLNIWEVSAAFVMTSANG